MSEVTSGSNGVPHPVDETLVESICWALLDELAIDDRRVRY